jgi:IMP cyclohydrolase
MYVGRIVVVGKTTQPFVAYRVSSRSFPNRIAKVTAADAVAIQPLDPKDLERNPYIAYNGIRVSPRAVVVSNGSHTDPIFELLDQGADPIGSIHDVLEEMGYEKDDYNTPRIVGAVVGARGFLGIVRDDGVEVEEIKLHDNACRLICTYELNHMPVDDVAFTAKNAAEAARFVVDGGAFAELELPVCAAAWLGELAVYNPHAK